MFVLQNDLLVFRSDAPLPEVFHPVHQTPSSHRPFIDSHPDPVDLAALLDIDSDDDATFEEDVKGKAGAVESLNRERSPEPQAALVVPKSRGQLCVRGRPVVISGNQSSSLVLFL